MTMLQMPSGALLTEEQFEKLKAQYLMGEITESDYRWLLGEGEDHAYNFCEKRIRSSTRSNRVSKPFGGSFRNT